MSFFIFNSNGKTIYLLAYINDILNLILYWKCLFKRHFPQFLNLRYTIKRIEFKLKVSLQETLSTILENWIYSQMCLLKRQFPQIHKIQYILKVSLEKTSSIISQILIYITSVSWIWFYIEGVSWRYTFHNFTNFNLYYKCLLNLILYRRCLLNGHLPQFQKKIQYILKVSIHLS